MRGGLTVASTDPVEIEGWWRRWPDANVAIRTGAASGLVVLDIDPAHGGDDSLARLIDQNGELPPGREISTGGGGRHLYFRHPDQPVRNDAGRRLGVGLDVRGDGGYVLAPPSRHRSGGTYSVAARGGEIPPLPEWLLGRMTASPTPPRDRPPVFHRRGDTTAWAKAALTGELRRLEQAPPGQRNNTLNRVAFRLGQIIAGGQLDEAEVEHMLVDSALSIGLTEREAAATVHSGLQAGECEPRGPAEPLAREAPAIR